MATRTEQFNMSQNGVFQGRITVAIESKAIAIAAESASGLESARRRLAIRVLKNPIEEAKGLGVVVVTNSVIAAKTPLVDPELDVTDAEIDTALSDAVWNGYAEAFA